MVFPSPDKQGYLIPDKSDHNPVARLITGQYQLVATLQQDCNLIFLESSSPAYCVDQRKN